MSDLSVIAQLRHLYAQMLTWGGNIPNAARGLLGPAIESLERIEAARRAADLTDSDREVLTAWRDQIASYRDTSLRLGSQPNAVNMKRLAVLDRLLGDKP